MVRSTKVGCNWLTVNHGQYWLVGTVNDPCEWSLIANHHGWLFTHDGCGLFNGDIAGALANLKVPGAAWMIYPANSNDLQLLDQRRSFVGIVGSVHQQPHLVREHHGIQLLSFDQSTWAEMIADGKEVPMSWLVSCMRKQVFSVMERHPPGRGAESHRRSARSRLVVSLAGSAKRLVSCMMSYESELINIQFRLFIRFTPIPSTTMALIICNNEGWMHKNK